MRGKGKRMTTFCYDRDCKHFDEWLGGELMQIAASPGPAGTEPVLMLAGDADNDDLDVRNSHERHAASESQIAEELRFSRSRNSAKPMTIRSWRDPHSVGGSFRKGAIKKIERRLREREPIFLCAPNQQ